MDLVHLGFAGNYEIARAVFDAVEDIVVLRFGVSLSPPASAPPTQEECEKRLAFTPDIFEAMIQATIDWSAYQRFAKDVLQDNIAWFQQELEVMKGQWEARHRDEATVLREALTYCGDDYALQRRLFYLLVKGSKCQEALELAQAICSRTPFRREAHRMLGLAHTFTGNPEKAAEAYEAECEQYPGSSETNCLLGEAYERLGRREDAIAAYRNALQLEPNNENAHRLLEDALKPDT
jgi:tetratricopeptide (TPR) repeat protein